MQAELTFYRDPAVPLLGTTPSSPWKYPGNALTASSNRIYAQAARLQKAAWYLVWTPNAGATYNAARLVKADNGPTNLEQIAFINRNNTNTPVVDSVDMTAALNAILDSLMPGESKQILMQTCGDAASAIYRSTIDLVWE